MNREKLEQLKQDVLSLLTDKNVGFTQVEGKDEEFGALLAYGKAFKEVNKLFTKYNI